MQYATAQDLIDRFGDYEVEQLATDFDQDTIDTDRLSQAISDAQAEINSYLGQRYSLPLVSVPSILKGACCDIARYYLHASQATEEVAARYNRRLTWLKDIAAKRAGLGIDQDVRPTTLTAASRQAGRRIFTRDTLADY